MNNTHPPLLFAATIGLDWADKKHDLWIQPAAGGKPEHLVIDQTPEALHEWVAKVRTRFANERIAIAIETSRGAVISALGAYDFIVLFPINPGMLCSYREAFCVSGAKDDRTDAMLLEEYLRLHRAKLRPLEPDTELTRKLAGLVENRRDLVDERTRLVNQLHSLLKTYYPLIHVLFDDLTSPMVVQFLLKWPDLASAKKAELAALRKFFYAHNSRSDKVMEQRLLDIGQARALTTDPALIEPAALKAQALAGMLKALHQSIDKLEKRIEQTTAAHPDAALFRSFPSAGPTMAPRLLVAFGTNRERFESAQEAQQFYGIAQSKSRAATPRSFTCATAARNLPAKHFTKTLATWSARMVGPKPVTNNSERGKRATMRLCVRSPLNSCGSISVAGNTSNPMTPTATKRHCKNTAVPWPNYSKTRQQLPVNNFQENVDGTTQSSPVIAADWGCEPPRPESGSTPPRGRERPVHRGCRQNSPPAATGQNAFLRKKRTGPTG
jgi:transposase